MLDLICVGHASYDITMAVAAHPQADEKMLADALDLAGGGPAANAALCAVRLGGASGFCGYLGRDLFGEAHWRELQQAGVDTSLIVRGDHPTPISQVLAKPDGSRSVVNFKGTTPTLAADAVAIRSAPKVMLFDGHEPDLSIRLCDRVTAAGAHGTATVLDAGSLHKGTEALTGRVDHLVASERFARQFTGCSDAAQALQRMPATAGSVVITLGERGLIWRRDGEEGRMPVFAVDAIDSTGAGDAFHAAFALGLSRGLAWHDLLRYASAAGALACTRLGARTAMPDAAQLAAFLAGRAAE